jgi:hypothetical protein
MHPLPFSRALTMAALLVAVALPAHAYNRRYVYSYEAGGMPKGLFEYEPWFTYKEFDTGFAWEFRNEFEYGVTDRLLVAAYVSDWSYENLNGLGKATWDAVGGEFQYTLSDPTIDPIGSAIYGEFKVGPEIFGLEGKLILHKNFGPLSVVYNAVVEAEWEGEDRDEEVGVIENTFGLSYQFNPKFFVGMEATHEVEFENWDDAGENAIYAGPNVSFRTSGGNLPSSGSFFATLAALVQVSDIDDEPDSQVRLIMGKFF